MIRSLWFWPAVIAIAAWLAVVSALDPVGEFPGNGEGPGLTLDEQFNVQQGVLMVDRILALDGPGFRKEVNALPDHPLLGRLWLGFFHEAAILLFRPTDPMAMGMSITCARSGSATAFAMLVFLIGWYGSRWYGRRAGIVSALAVVLMPRVFGHAHLAALESCVNLTWCAAVLCLADYADQDRPPRWWQAALLGALFGLALLTKIQGVLLPIPLGLWMLYRWRWKGLGVATIWLLAGLAVFFAGWPWLWSDTLAHVQRFFGSSTNRSSISVWYFGEKFVDKDVPWHYPWVLFLTTVPVGLHLLGFLGLPGWGRKYGGADHSNASRSYREVLLLAAMLFLLILFSIPRVAVYDGERLFLMVFPLWALFAGRGVNRISEWWKLRRQRELPAWPVALFLAAQAYGLFVVAPCHLSYYNLLVGGLRGADRLGLPVTYWGDSVTRSFLRDVAQAVPPGKDLRFIPAMHKYQLLELQERSVSLRTRSLQLRPYNEDGNPHPPYLLLFQRNDYVPEEFHRAPAGAELLASFQREGVILAALYHFPQTPILSPGSR